MEVPNQLAYYPPVHQKKHSELWDKHLAHKNFSETVSCMRPQVLLQWIPKFNKQFKTLRFWAAHKGQAKYVDHQYTCNKSKNCVPLFGNNTKETHQEHEYVWHNLDTHYSVQNTSSIARFFRRREEYFHLLLLLPIHKDRIRR